jgi:hypothetical protein
MVIPEHMASFGPLEARADCRPQRWNFYVEAADEDPK